MTLAINARAISGEHVRRITVAHLPGANAPQTTLAFANFSWTPAVAAGQDPGDHSHVALAIERRQVGGRSTPRGCVRQQSRRGAGCPAGHPADPLGHPAPPGRDAIAARRSPDGVSEVAIPAATAAN